MAANLTPIFTKKGNIGRAVVGASANAKSNGDGTIGTDIMLLFTPDTEGSWLSAIRFRPVASAAATNTTATTLRAYLSTLTSGATTGGTNTWLLDELSAAAQPADHSTAASNALTMAINMMIPVGLQVLVSAHVVNAANTAWHALAIGGDY